MRWQQRLAACVVITLAVVWDVALAGQAGILFAGRLVNALTGEAIPGATVQIDELRRQAVSTPEGTFAFENVPSGTYHLSVRTPGYSSRRIEIMVSATPSAAMDVPVDPDLHFGEVVSVSAEAPRSQFEAFQPTSVLTGQDLAKQLEMSIGATLESEPGVASRSFGPAPARPVIRGLDGDRVLILQDGQRMGDLSSQSGDHGVTINPAAAQRIEVVRGPATLLYGANAIGGLVNVISEDIPVRRQQGATGNLTLDAGSAASEAGAAFDVLAGNGKYAFHAGGAARRSGDVDTPLGEVTNSQSRTGIGNIGASWTGDTGYFGGSYGYDDTKYGIPVVEGGILQLTPRRHSFSFRGGAQGRPGAFDSYRATLTVRRYQHDELEGEEVGTAFTNNTAEMEVMGSHRPLGRAKGSLGGWLLTRAFSATGAEALSPAVDQKGIAAFLYEEVTWPHVTLQFGGRVDHARFAPAGEPRRDFTNGSASAGLLFRPAAADDRLTVAASLARSARNPALEELFFFGLHHGNFAIELGNPGLESEHALGFDVALRWRWSRASGEVAYFRNDIQNYIFRDQLDAEEFEAREAEFTARFPGRTLVGHDDHDATPDAEEADEALAIVNFVGADAGLQGFEAHADFQVAPRLVAEAGIDYVRGSLKGTGEPLPRVPPFRGRGGLRYQHNSLQVGGEVQAVAAQQRVSGIEQPTEGYALLKLFASYSFNSAGAVSTVTARLDNATDRLYRNHLSLIKNVVPEMGRNFKLLYTVKF